MDFIQRLERNIKNNFPGIAEGEMKERLSLAKHIIALNYENKLRRNHITYEEVITTKATAQTTSAQTPTAKGI